MKQTNGLPPVCPFYRSEGLKTIRCEGIISGELTHRFDEPESQRAFRSRFCGTFDYPECPHAALLLRKYRRDAK
jgi:hypothetical protein